MSDLNVRLWMGEAAKTIPYTLGMWIVFLVLIYTHAEIPQTYSVRQAVVGTISSVVGNPLLGI
jgi:hypothetical protein